MPKRKPKRNGQSGNKRQLQDIGPHLLALERDHSNIRVILVALGDSRHIYGATVDIVKAGIRHLSEAGERLETCISLTNGGH